MAEYLSSYHQSLTDKSTFSVSWELVPGRGSVESAQQEVIRCAEQAGKGGKVNALTITDNPGGNPAISAEMLGAEVTRLGGEPLVHFTCKDKNRNQLEALLYGLERAGVRNFLVMSGDYTAAGYGGRPRPVFDLDPTHLLELISGLNKGLKVTFAGRSTVLAPAHFYAGAVVSPFKKLESEQMGQYFKLKKKLDAGAQFIVTQVGYDARKFQEALKMVAYLGFGHIPVVGNIYVLTKGVARLMNRNGVAGCVVTDKMLAMMEGQASSKAADMAAALERAARMYAFMKGMGFTGAHIGGHGLRYQDVEQIIGRGEELAPNWLEIVREFDYPQTDGWHYFEQDPVTGLNTDTPVDRSTNRPPTPLSYRGFRLLHRSMFDTKGVLFKPMSALARAIDGSRVEHAFTRFEHVMKAITNECLHCGDCGLPDVAYLCPTSQCPKGQRNGPCGGSYEGWCEVHPAKQQCIYVRAYPRLKHYGEENSLIDHEVPPLDYDLWQTASWLNFFMGRDHSSRRLGIAPPEKKKK